jgi:opacity protein-like surface antigen
MAYGVNALHLTRPIILVFSLTLLSSIAFAQVFTNKEVGKKNADLIDSLKNSEYPYSLPILGAKAHKAGYALPYSAGLSINYFWQQSDLIIENLSVGFNHGPMYNLDEIIRFDKAFATASATTIRPDIWLLPFLNVYGIFGKAAASTDIGFGVWIPDSSGTSSEIINASTTVEFNTSTYGFGITPTIGVGGGFLALDMNMAWTDVPQLSKPARSFVFGPRFGKNFKINKTKTPEQSIAVWVGAFRVALQSETNGSLELSEVFNVDEIGGKVDQGIAKVGDAQQKVDAWWAGLSNAEQNNPVNEAKYNAANRALTRAGEILASADNAINNIATSSVQYSMDKRPKDAWNFIIGSQYQLNKHWMLRAEYGFLGSRVQFITGVQYRFGL